MSSYAHAKYEVLQYSTNGAYGYEKAGGGFSNSSGHYFGGAGGGYGAFGGCGGGYGTVGGGGGGYGTVGGYASRYNNSGYGVSGGYNDTYYGSGGHGANSGYSHGGSYGGPYGGGGGYGSYGKTRMDENKIQNMAPTTVVAGPGSEPVVGDPISALVPTSFPPGTDPKFIECFNQMDRDRNGSICDQELQSALSTFDQRFSLRTVHLLMYLFTGNANAVGPKEFVPLIRSLQSWKASFEMHDRNKNGSMDERELREALMSMGYNLSPFVLRILVSKFDKSGAKSAIEYDYFIECCLVIKGLTEKFKTKEDPYTGVASFTYDEFLLSVLPFIIMN